MKNLFVGIILTGVFISFSFLQDKKEHDNDLKTVTIRDTVRIFEPKQGSVVNLDAIAGRSDQKYKKNTSSIVQNVSIAKSTVEIKDKRVYNFQPLNNLNFQIDHWKVDELRRDMYHHQFTNLDGLDLNALKEIRMAYYYDKLLWDIHERTDLGIGIIWAFLRIEAFNTKINESWLLREAWNFGGIKYRKDLHSAYVLANDDCESKCKFAKFNSYEEGMQAWANVFNSPRYKKCKTYGNTLETFNCIYKSGYHTHNNVSTRNNLCKRYWKLKKHFPNIPSKI